MPKADVHFDKNELKRPDVFLQTIERSWSALEKNRSLVLGLVALLFIGGIVFVALEFFQRRGDVKSAEELYKVEASYLKLREGYDRAKYEALSPPPPKDPKAKDQKPEEKPKAASGDLQTDYGSVVQDLEGVVQKTAKTPAGAQAAILLSDLYIEYKQPEKAVQVLDQVVPHVDKKSMLYGLTNLQHGTALTAKGDCPNAVSSYQKVIDNPDISFLHPDALLKAGVCLETMNQTDKARINYQTIVEQFNESAAAQSAKTLLRALEAKPAATTGTAG